MTYLAVGQGPTYSAQPAILLRHVVAPVKARYLARPALLECGGECRLGLRVAHPRTGKDRHCGDALREKITAPAVNTKHSTMPHVTIRKSGCSQRQDQPS